MGKPGKIISYESQGETRYAVAYDEDQTKDDRLLVLLSDQHGNIFTEDLKPQFRVIMLTREPKVIGFID